MQYTVTGRHVLTAMMNIGTRFTFKAFDSSTLLTIFAARHIVPLHCSSSTRYS
jgi:hypothetical protein